VSPLKDCAAIAKGLEDNHTLLGIHISGNNAHVDAYGFMHPGRQGHYIESLTAHVFVPIMGDDSVSSIAEALAAENEHDLGLDLDKGNATSTQEYSNNWVTDRWDKVDFVWAPSISDADSVQPAQSKVCPHAQISTSSTTNSLWNTFCVKQPHSRFVHALSLGLCTRCLSLCARAALSLALCKR
jgi:hypothetical protein